MDIHIYEIKVNNVRNTLILQSCMAENFHPLIETIEKSNKLDPVAKIMWSRMLFMLQQIHDRGEFIFPTIPKNMVKTQLYIDGKDSEFSVSYMVGTLGK